MVGPIVRAGQFPKGTIAPKATKPHGPNLQQEPFAVPSLTIADKAPDQWLTPDGGPLAYRSTGIGQDIRFRPLYASQERYAVYWKTV
jgi:hypothetical protein